MTAERSAVLCVRDLVVGYSATADVLRGISIDVGASEAVALLGSNGAGKTTLLRAVSGLLRPREGSIRLGGVELGSLAPHAVVRAGVAHVPEGRCIFVHQTVRDNLLLGAGRSRDAHERLEQVLELLPMLRPWLGRLGGELSGGQQQVLAIARGLMARPRLLLLDEPSLGLSPLLVGELIQVLQKVRGELDMALLLAEQNLELAGEVAERAYVLSRGEIALEQPSESLIANPEVVAAAYLGGAPPPRR